MGIIQYLKHQLLPLPPPPMPEGLSYVEKERILVEYITTADMRQFHEIPYDLNCVMHKENKPRSHPFAYYILNEKNQKIAREHLQQLNDIIDFHRDIIPKLTNDVYIDVDKIMYQPYGEDYGYSRLMCSPYSFDGSLSPKPISLNFSTRLDVHCYQALGEIIYKQNGHFQSACVNIWKDISPSKGSNIGWFFTFSTVDSEFVLYEVKHLESKRDQAFDAYCMPISVYKHPTLIAWEEQREKDQNTFAWLESNLPQLCPKSFSGFRRMRSQNTKNYQKLVAEAAKLGKRIS